MAPMWPFIARSTAGHTSIGVYGNVGPIVTYADEFHAHGGLGARCLNDLAGLTGAWFDWDVLRIDALESTAHLDMRDPIV